MSNDTLDVSPLIESEFAAWLPHAEAYMAFYKTVRQPAEYVRFWERLHANVGLHALGARINGELVGITHFLFHANSWSSDVCYLQDLYVVPAVRGKGVGRALIEHVRERARMVGAPRVYWLTHSSNETARKLYDQVAQHTGFLRYEIDMA